MEEKERLEILPLHNHTEYQDGCADLINNEWARSKTARLHVLRKSCDQLPLSLVMVTHNTSSKQSHVIGHSMLSRVIGIKDACFVESVVVDKNLRGKGLGRKLMDASEEYMASLGYRTVYLSTHDKQSFYQHLGYRFCEPISKSDACTKLLPAAFLQQLCRSPLSRIEKKGPSKKPVKKGPRPETNSPSGLPPPPPPPLQFPPPPLQFPPPPPLQFPPPSPSQSTSSTLLNSVKLLSITKDDTVPTDSDSISWMNKELH